VTEKVKLAAVTLTTLPAKLDWLTLPHASISGSRGGVAYFKGGAGAAPPRGHLTIHFWTGNLGYG
jgi:hypothetical protein